MQTFGRIDVRDRLDAIQAPTLVLHSRGDQLVDMDAARELVSGIAGARFQSLDSDNHSLIDREPASLDFTRAIIEFTKTSA
jgi:pimeloyl-ACP methyl ester carboxylesterase